MADISLLPEEMRKKEEDRSKSGQKPATVSLHIPGAEDVSKTKPSIAPPARTAGPGFMARVFGKRPAPQPQGAKNLPTVSMNVPPKSPAPVMSKPIVVAPPPVKPVAPPMPPKPVVVPSRAPKPAPAPIAPPAPAPKPVIKPVVSPPPPPSPRPNPTPVAPKIALHEVEAGGSAGLRVSLIPTATERAPDVRTGLRVVVAVVVAAVAVAVLGYAVSYWYVNGKKNEAAALELRAKAAVQSTAEMRDRLADARTEAKRLKNIGILLDTHVTWTKFFDFLEKNTHKDIAFTQFTTEGLDSVTMQAEALDYRAIAEQVQDLSSAAGVVAVKVSGITSVVAPTGQMKFVRLTMTLKFAPELVQAKPTAAVAAK